MYVRRLKRADSRHRASSRRGVGALEYVLILSTMFMLVLILMRSGIDLIQVVYEFMASWVAWPFL